MAKAKPATPGNRKRPIGLGSSRLRQTQAGRGRQRFNIWYLYSPRLRRDVTLSSDVEFAHFCWVEGDPTVLRYELEPTPTIVAVGDELQRTQFDALVELRSGRPQLREIKTSEENLSPRELAQREAQERAAVAAGFDYVRITHTDLAKHAQLIRNWRCAIAFQAACRELMLASHCEEILTIVRGARKCTLEEILRETSPDSRPKYLAALFRCVQEAKIMSDLDSRPLCGRSIVWAPEATND